MQNTRTAELSREGVSIWLDDLSRDRIRAGGLQSLVAERNVVGITTNPTIFATALGASDAYDAQILELARAGASVEETIAQLISHDVAAACDILIPLYESSGGLDGRVSIEVSPVVAHDGAATLLEARDLLGRVNRANAFIKIPATAAGIQAIADATAEGLDVNVTLIFGLDRYREVIDAYLTGLERAHAAGIPLSGIRSVASFFVSRVDLEVDRRLAELGTGEELRSAAGIANARLAYGVYRDAFASERARRLLALGANPQRPLWASTGVKDPTLPDTRYVTELVAPGVVNTMPAKTLEAFADHGEVRGDTITGALAAAQDTLDALAAAGVSFDEATATLEREGIEKFTASWAQLVDAVEAALVRGGLR